MYTGSALLLGLPPDVHCSPNCPATAEDTVSSEEHLEGDTSHTSAAQNGNCVLGNTWKKCTVARCFNPGSTLLQAIVFFSLYIRIILIFASTDSN